MSFSEELISFSPKKGTIIEGVFTPEHADALKQASEMVGNIAVSVLDPSDPEQTDRYINKSESGTQLESANEQVKKMQAERARDIGHTIVVIESRHQDMGPFWRRVDGIIATLPVES